MDKLILQMLNQHEGQSVNSSFNRFTKAGCTATVALITPNMVYCANAGDSRTVMCDNGQTVEMSKDHVPTLPKETERIYKAGGKVIRGRVNGILSCSRAIGDIDLKKSMNYALD